jgi:hypothetical protein
MLFALGLGAQTKAPAREGFSGVMRSTPPALSHPHNRPSLHHPEQANCRDLRERRP